MTMGSYDGVEVCELIGIFALAHLTKQIKKGDVGLYRDNGLAVLRGMSRGAAERAKKDVTKCFDDLGLRITIQPNLKIVDFLDLTFNLNNARTISIENQMTSHCILISHRIIHHRY